MDLAARHGHELSRLLRLTRLLGRDLVIRFARLLGRDLVAFKESSWALFGHPIPGCPTTAPEPLHNSLELRRGFYLKGQIPRCVQAHLLDAALEPRVICENCLGVYQVKPTV
jgi:hypothetical protein